jgi:phage gp36-like protein
MWGSELIREFNCRELSVMSDQELAVQAISEAQQILEEYLEPTHERLLDRLVEVLERPSVLVAVGRLQRGQ